MRFTLLSASTVAALACLVNGKACRPDVCGLVVQGQHSDTPQQIANHRLDCSSFLSISVIPATSTVYVIVSSTVATSSDTVSVLSSTETNTVTVTSILTSVSIEPAATTVESTVTGTTTTTSTTTSTAVVVSSSTWTSPTTTTTSITGISSATHVLTSVASETVSSTTTVTTTKTSTSTSTSILVSQQVNVPKRSVAVSVDQAITIIPSLVPQYATQACSNTLLYSSACSAWGVVLRTTIESTPTTVITSTIGGTEILDVDGHATVKVDKSMTNTATDVSVEVSSTTVVHTDSATETDTLTSSATVTSTSIVPVEVVSTKTLTSSTATTLTTTTTTTSTGTTTTIETVSHTVSTTVGWCTNGAVVKATGCYQSDWTLYCNQVISPISNNPVVFNAPQETLDQCINICDSNGWCTSGQFNGETGQCLLYLYSGSNDETLVPTPGAVTSFQFVYGTGSGESCQSYECPYSGVSECCGGSGCANLQAPY
ncbi:hypothetical protein SEUCBS139899_009036 [Sporothrix eucalyptigena]|uniref:Apple domain-containing protein n=1 Tax=Sporothrix eucalyptigena TaxID=1812306 RepID=A0ABP0C4M7_9PEZI